MSVTHTNPPALATLSELVRKQTAEFEQEGGKITFCPSCEYTTNQPAQQAYRINSKKRFIKEAECANA